MSTTTRPFPSVEEDEFNKRADDLAEDTLASWPDAAPLVDNAANGPLEAAQDRNKLIWHIETESEQHIRLLQDKLSNAQKPKQVRPVVKAREYDLESDYDDGYASDGTLEDTQAESSEGRPLLWQQPQAANNGDENDEPAPQKTERQVLYGGWLGYICACGGFFGEKE